MITRIKHTKRLPIDAVSRETDLENTSSTADTEGKIVCSNANSTLEGVRVALSRVKHNLEILTSVDELAELAKLRRKQFKKYPQVRGAIDQFDKNACILIGKNEKGEITSTGRIVFDGPQGLPADLYAKSEVDKLRQWGLVIVEISKFAIEPGAKGILKYFLWAFYEIAIELGIDVFVSINPRKDVNVYKKIYAAEILLPDIGYSYGTDDTFALLMHCIKLAKPRLSAWLREELS